MYTVKLTFTDFDSRTLEHTTVVTEAHNHDNIEELEFLGSVNGVDIDVYELTAYEVTHKG